MSMVMTVDGDQELIRADVTGIFSLVEAEKTFLELLDAVRRHGSSKVLFNGREIDGEPRTIERFLYGEFVADEVAKMARSARVRAPVFAYVLKEPVRDPDRFGETVAVNRGMRVRSFDNLEDAMTWLVSTRA